MPSSTRRHFRRRGALALLSALVVLTVMLPPHLPASGAATDVTAPTLASFSLNASTYRPGSTVTMTYSVSDPDDAVSTIEINYTTPIGGNFHLSGANGRATGTITASMVAGTYTLDTIEIWDGASNSSLYRRDGTVTVWPPPATGPTSNPFTFSLGDFTVTNPSGDATTPTLRSFSLASGSSATPGSTVSMRYSASDPDDAVSIVYFIYGTPGGGGEFDLSASGPTAATGPATGAITSGLPTGTYILKTVEVFDSVSNSAIYHRDGSVAVNPAKATGPTTNPFTLSSGDFTVTKPPPTTTTTSPPPPAVKPPPQSSSPAPPPRSGYWMLGQGGAVYTFGEAGYLGNAAIPAGQSATGIATTPSGNGYWIVSSGGGVSAFGDARLFGGDPPLAPGERLASLSPTLDGAGYWLFTSFGRVFTYGDAAFFGDMSGTRLNGPVLGSIATPSGNGYYMVASDGGIFTFGDARFHGSMGDQHLNGPVVGLAPAPGGGGYWLVASDGGIFAFDAPFRGSMGSTPLSKPVVGMVAYGDGYLMVAADGGIFDFSSQPFVGSLGGNPPAVPVVAVAPLNS